MSATAHVDLTREQADALVSSAPFQLLAVTAAIAKLYVDDEVVAEGPMRAQIGYFALCGDGQYLDLQGAATADLVRD
jgi:hypothetical protein